MKIGMDVDDVIIDMHTPWLERINAEYGTKWTKEDMTQWNFYVDFGLTAKQAYKHLVPELYNTALPYEGALDVVNELRRLGHEVIFISSCPDMEHWSAKLNWLMRHKFLLPDTLNHNAAYPVGKWAHYQTKRAVGQAHGIPVLVDDHIGNCTDWDGVALLLTRHHNRGLVYPGKRLRNLNQLVSEIKFMKIPSAEPLHVQIHVAHDNQSKPTNPKDAIAVDKLPLHLWPETATMVASLAMLEGALKYGRSNFRAIGVRSSVYYDAARRHLNAWFEGEDVAPDSEIDHLGHALACIAIIIDAREAGKLNDDRAVKGGYHKLVEKLTPMVKRLRDKYKDREPKHYTKDDIV